MTAGDTDYRAAPEATATIQKAEISDCHCGEPIIRYQRLLPPLEFGREWSGWWHSFTGRTACPTSTPPSRPGPPADAWT